MILTPIQAPNANAHAERVIETMRAECLDWTLILGRRHLDRMLRTYAEHYNRQRPYRALALATPVADATDPRPVSPRDTRRRDLLGGLIHEYRGSPRDRIWVFDPHGVSRDRATPRRSTPRKPRQPPAPMTGRVGCPSTPG